MNNDGNNFIRDYFETLNNEIKHTTKSFEQEVKDMYKNLEKEERKKMKQDHKEQMKDLNDLMDAFDDFYKQNKSSLSDLDKAMYRTLVSNRKKDIKKFDSSINKTFNELDKEISKMGSSFNKVFNGIDSALGKLKGVIDTLNLSHIVSDGLAKDEESLFEVNQNLTRLTNYTKENSKELNKLYKEIYNKSGGSISKLEQRTLIQDIRDELGLTDIKQLTELMQQSVYAMEYLQIGVDQIAEVYKSSVMLNSDTYLRDITNMMAQIQEEGMSVNMDNITEVLNKSTPYLQTLTGNNEAMMKKMSKDLIAAVTAGEEHFVDISEVISNFTTGSYDLDSYVGALAWKNQGNLKGFMTDLIDAIHGYNTGRPQMNRQIYGDLGIDPDFAQNVLASNMSAEDWLKSYEENQALIDNTLDYEAEMLTKEDTKYDLMEKMYNWMSGTGLGSLLSEIFSDNNISLTDVWAGGTMLSGLLKGGGSLFGKLLGEGGLLAGAGTKLGGLFTGAGTKLGGLLAGVGGTTAAGILGGLGGLLGIGSGIKDFWNASKLKGEDRSNKLWSGGTKLGMVGTGAGIGAVIGSVVPVIGTGIGALVGAGVGGLGAIFTGGKVGEWLKKSNNWMKEKFKSAFF